MKYIVLARYKDTKEIAEVFGCYKNINNAIAEKEYLPTGEYYDGIEYCVEEVDPLGSFANEKVMDE